MHTGDLTIDSNTLVQIKSDSKDIYRSIAFVWNKNIKRNLKKPACYHKNIKLNLVINIDKKYFSSKSAY